MKLKTLILSAIILLNFSYSFTQDNNIQWLVKNDEQNVLNDYRILKTFSYKGKIFVLKVTDNNLFSNKDIFKISQIENIKSEKSDISITQFNNKSQEGLYLNIYDIIEIKNNLYLFYTQFNDKENATHFYVSKINAEGELKIDFKTKLISGSSKSFSNECNFYLHFNQDSTLMGLQAMGTIYEKKLNVLDSYMFSTKDFSLLNKFQSTWNMTRSSFDILDFCIDHKGNFNIFYEQLIGKVTECFSRKLISSTKFEDKPIFSNDKNLYDAKYVLFKDQTKIIGTFLKDIKINDDLRGIYLLDLDDLDKFDKGITFLEFSKELLLNFISESKILKGKGIDIHNFKNITTDENKNIYLFLENRGSNASFLTFNNIIFVKVSSNNKIVFDKVFFKNQQVKNAGGPNVTFGNSLFNWSEFYFGYKFYLNQPYFMKPYIIHRFKHEYEEGASFKVVNKKDDLLIYYNGHKEDIPTKEGNNSQNFASLSLISINIKKANCESSYKKTKMDDVILPLFSVTNTENETLFIAKRRMVKNDYSIFKVK